MKQSKRRTRKTIKTRKIRKTKGAGLVSYGSFGCGFSPALRCSDQAKAADRTFSKFMLKSRGVVEELEQTLYIQKIDPEGKYSVYTEKSCDVHPDEFNTYAANFKQCHLLAPYYPVKPSGVPFDPFAPTPAQQLKSNSGKFIVLQSPHGGVEMLDYLNQIQAAYTSKQSFSLTRAYHLFHAVANLLDGLETYHAGGFYHMDIKPENILLEVNERGYALRAKFIDFGLSCTREPENYAKQFPYYARPNMSRPFELAFVTVTATQRSQLTPETIRKYTDTFYKTAAVPHRTPFDHFYKAENVPRMDPDSVPSWLFPILDSHDVPYFLERADIYAMGLTLYTIIQAMFGIYIFELKPHIVDESGNYVLLESRGDKGVLGYIYANCLVDLGTLTLSMMDWNPEGRPDIASVKQQYTAFLGKLDAVIQTLYKHAATKNATEQTET